MGRKGDVNMANKLLLRVKFYALQSDPLLKCDGAKGRWLLPAGITKKNILFTESDQAMVKYTYKENKHIYLLPFWK